MSLTQHEMRTLWRMLNDLCFDGKLDEPKFTTGSCEYTDVFGVYYPDQERIHIDQRCDTLALVMSTMAHEMIHQWQDENNLPVNHGNKFRSMAALIKRRTGLTC